MNQEKQVSNIELSERLKELGVKQDSCFYWRSDGFELLRVEEMRSDWYDEFPSAFSVAELGEMLPRSCWTQRNMKEIWHARKESHVILRSDTEANARAKMLICLLENKLITL